MSTAVSLGLAQWLLAFAAMGCLGLSRQRHARQRGAAFPPQRWHTPLWWGGCLLLVLTLLAAVLDQGWGFGMVSLLGVLSATSLMVVALITYQPRWLLTASLTCALVGPALVFAYLAG